jgi:hypothetical protein
VSTSLLIIVALIYWAVAIGYYMDGRPGMSLAFIAYAFANIGFALDVVR